MNKESDSIPQAVVTAQGKGVGNDLGTQTSAKTNIKLYKYNVWFGVLCCFFLMGLVLLVGPYSADIELIRKDQAFWYYWQLPTPTTMGFISAWLGYLLHQAGSWWLIAKAKRERGPYVAGLRPINLWSLAFNGSFVLLHILQSKLWYDGLAQNFSPLASQFAVIFMLVFILILENPRRGLLFGKKMPIKQKVSQLVKDYHGYYFSWAIVFTFWFHPIELTLGHLFGTFYVLLLMLQGSLIFTQFHRNRWWTVSLECIVLFHGAMVAYLSPMQSMEMVAMFAFGFLTIFVVTQIYGLGVKRNIIWAVTAGYILLLLVYYWGRWTDVTVVLRVPFIEYGFVLVFALLLTGMVALSKKIRD